MNPKDSIDFQPAEESNPAALTRHGIRSVSRVAETLGGAGGDIQQLARAGVSGLYNLGTTAAESLAGKELPALRNFSDTFAQVTTPQFLPTTEDIKKSSEKHTKGLTKARGRGEEFSDNVISDLTSLLMGGGKPSVQTVLRGLGSSVVGNVSKEVLKDAGVGNFGQYLGKTGTMILSAMFNPKGAKNYVADLYKQRDATIPKGTIVPTSAINPFVNQVEKDLSKGIATEAKSSIKKTLTNLKSKIASGYVELEEILQMKKDLNGIRGELIGKNRLAGGTDKMVQQEINHLNKLSSGVESILADYGKNNPEFYKLHQMANTGHSGLEESKFISNSIIHILLMSKLN